MKKNYTYLLLLILPAVFMLYSYHTGSPGGYTGSFMDNRNCTQCHTSFASVETEGWITSDIPESGYVPGETYRLTLTANDMNAVKFGFELTAESGDTKVGTYTITDAVRTKLIYNDHSVTHTSGGIDPVGHGISWSVNWTAPESSPDQVVFYAAVNAANGNGQNSGDLIYLTDTTYHVSTVGIADKLLKDRIKIYPNPASSFIHVDLPVGSELSMLNMKGQQLIHKEKTTSSERMDLSELPGGIYFIKVASDGAQATLRIIKN